MKKITIIFTVLLVVAIAVYDVWAILNGGVEASISHLLITASYKWPLIPFLFGVLCGHLFWRMGDTKDTLKLKKP